jgi:hypothetical protein
MEKLEKLVFKLAVGTFILLLATVVAVMLLKGVITLVQIVIK